jgi:hypothetical protein
MTSNKNDISVDAPKVPVPDRFISGREMGAGSGIRLRADPIGTSRNVENAVVSHGHLEHGMHILTKPFSMDVLAARINQLLHDVTRGERNK